MSYVVTLSRAEPTARKSHRCSLCGRIVNKGETYERQANIYDGRAYTWKSCAHCTAFMSLHTSLRENVHYDAEGWDSERVWEWDYCASVWEARLRAMFRRRWTRRDGTLYPIPDWR